jgi:hypothetical protein
MIEDSPIVNDTRKIRELISQKFSHDIDRYLDYLSTQTQDVSSQILVKRKPFKVRSFHLGQDVQCDRDEIYAERL